MFPNSFETRFFKKMSAGKRKMTDITHAWERFKHAESVIAKSYEALEKLEDMRSNKDYDESILNDTDVAGCKKAARKKVKLLLKQHEKCIKDSEKEMDTHIGVLTKHAGFSMSAYIAKRSLEDANDGALKDWKSKCDQYLEQKRPCTVQRGHITETVPWSGSDLTRSAFADKEEAEEAEVDVLDDTGVPLKHDIADKLNYYKEGDDADDKEEPSFQVTSGALQIGHFRLHPAMATQLKSHQTEAVKKIITVLGIKQKSGFLLAHSMGLGKTFTTIAAIQLLAASCPELRVIITCPKTVCTSWHGELYKWNSCITFKFFTDEKQRDIDLWKMNGGLIVMGNENFRTQQFEQSLDPDLLVVDEAHNLKNVETRLYVTIDKCPCRKLLISGTPLQNNLMEYHNMISLINPALFDAANFKKQFLVPIERGAMSDASDVEIMASRKAIKVFGLHTDQCIDRRSTEALKDSLPPMHDFKLTYKVPGIKDITSNSSFADTQNTINFTHGHKMIKACALIDAIIRQTSDSILVFSKRVDVIEKLQDLRGGNIMFGKTEDKVREQLVGQFAKDTTRLFYMTVGTGAVGLNLQKANRILILDPSWNPVTDNQACFRAYRLGQTKQVYIYRFIAEASIEETIYRLAVHKTLSACRILDDRDVERHFTRDQLKKFDQFDEVNLETTTDDVLNSVLNQFSGCTSHNVLFAETTAEELSNAEYADAENQFNIDCSNRKTRQVMLDNVLREVAIGSLYFNDVLLPPVKICNAGVSLSTPGAYRFFALQPQSTSITGYKISIHNNHTDTVFTQGDPSEMCKIWEMKLKSGCNYLRAKVLINNEESEWSDWSAAVIF